MLIRFRERSALCAAALIVLLAMLGLPHSADPHHDADERIVVIVHDEAAHRIAAATAAAATAAPHCVVCHLMRSFRPRVDGRSPSTPPAHAGTRIQTAVFTFFSAGSVAQPPLRSPPASPISA